MPENNTHKPQKSIGFESNNFLDVLLQRFIIRIIIVKVIMLKPAPSTFNITFWKGTHNIAKKR